MTTSEALMGVGISVVASIIVLVGSFLCQAFWFYYLKKKCLQFTCKHLPDISGEWVSEYDVSNDKLKARDETRLKQYGYIIEGQSIMTYKNKSDNCEEKKEFELRGILRNETFSGYYYNKDRKKIGSGSFSYVLKNSGDILEGGGIFYNSDTGKNEYTAYELKRLLGDHNL